MDEQATEETLSSCSVIVCTHNRENIIGQSIRSLLRQSYPVHLLEIIIVDNGSTDGTKQVVASIGSSAPFPIKYVYEPEIGLSIARNRGLAHARGDIVVYIDDDATPRNADWLRRLVGVYRDCQVCAAGGGIELVWPDGKPPRRLHRDQFFPLGLTLFHFTEITELQYPVYPWGGNISFRKESIRRLNGFSANLGRVGKFQMGNEETELCMRLEKEGKKIVYVPHAVVCHLVTRDRLTMTWFEKNAMGQGLSDATLEVMHLSKARLLRKCIRHLLNLSLLWPAIIIRPPVIRKYSLFFCYRWILSWNYMLRVLRFK